MSTCVWDPYYHPVIPAFEVLDLRALTTNPKQSDVHELAGSCIVAPTFYSPFEIASGECRNHDAKYADAALIASIGDMWEPVCKLIRPSA